MIVSIEMRRAANDARIAIAAMVLAMTVAASGAAWPQASPAPAEPAREAPRPAPENPGLINEIGKLLSNPSSLLPSFKGSTDPGEPSSAAAPETLAQPPEGAAPVPAAPVPAAPAAKQVAPAPPAARPAAVKPAAPAEAPAATAPAAPAAAAAMVTGRATCPLAANGAPDCKTAAAILCIHKGFKDGKSVAIDTVEKCSAKLLIPGRTRQPGDCKTENYVTRAFCQ
jgi:hypothetical protein